MSAKKATGKLANALIDCSPRKTRKSAHAKNTELNTRGYDAPARLTKPLFARADQLEELNLMGYLPAL